METVCLHKFEHIYYRSIYICVNALRKDCKNVTAIFVAQVSYAHHFDYVCVISNLEIYKPFATWCIHNNMNTLLQGYISSQASECMFAHFLEHHQ